MGGGGCAGLPGQRHMLGRTPKPPLVTETLREEGSRLPSRTTGYENHMGEQRPSSLTIGAAFPNLDLPDHAGQSVRLSEIGAGEPLLVQFYRGWWCPKEQAFFRKLVELQSDAEVAYTRFVSISTDATDIQAPFRAGIGARWVFLSDHERRWIDRLGLVESTDSEHRPYVPTVFTLAPDLSVHSVYDGYWYWGRPTLDELRQDFRAISQDLRPHWKAPLS